MRTCSSRASERGTSLVIVIMLLMVVSGLVAAIIASSMTDTLVSRNHHSGAQAQAAAEAGLNHAIDAARVYLRNWESTFSNTNDAVSRLLRGPDDLAGTTAADADNGSLAWIANGTPTPPGTLVLAGLNNVRYEGRIYDDDDAALQNGWTAIDLGRPKVMEGYVDVSTGVRVADATVDRNGIFVVRATGYAADNTAVTVEAVMMPRPWPAIVTNGDLNLAGSPAITGDGGSIHSNGSITEVGMAAVVQGDVTAVSNIASNPSWSPVNGLIEAGQLPIPIPPVNVSDYVASANYKLGVDGTISRRPTAADPWTTICTTTNLSCKNMGFAWSSSGGSISDIPGIARNWDTNNPLDCTTLQSNGVPDCGYGVYYVEQGDVTLSGNLGTSTAPYRMSLLVEGSVRITGTPQLETVLQNPRIMIVTNGDLKMLGTADCVIYGQMRVREQFELAGRMTLVGQILVENRTNVSTLVDQNRVYGNAHVTNDRLAVYDFSVAGWREFRR
jgi:Tfp pilus assembly protein PilX